MSITLTPADFDCIESFANGYYRFTLDGLREGTRDYDELIEWFSDRGIGYIGTLDDLIDDLDGTVWLDDRPVDLDESMSSPVWKRLRKIAREALRGN